LQFFRFSFVFSVYYAVFCFLLLVIITSAIDCLERLISEMIYYASSGMSTLHIHSLQYFIDMALSHNYIPE